jgi:hypothetical protein
VVLSCRFFVNRFSVFINVIAIRIFHLPEETVVPSMSVTVFLETSESFQLDFEVGRFRRLVII